MSLRFLVSQCWGTFIWSGWDSPNHSLLKISFVSAYGLLSWGTALVRGILLSEGDGRAWRKSGSVKVLEFHILRAALVWFVVLDRNLSLSCPFLGAVWFCWACSGGMALCGCVLLLPWHNSGRSEQSVCLCGLVVCRTHKLSEVRSPGDRPGFCQESGALGAGPCSISWRTYPARGRRQLEIRWAAPNPSYLNKNQSTNHSFSKFWVFFVCSIFFLSVWNCGHSAKYALYLV